MGGWLYSEMGNSMRCYYPPPTAPLSRLNAEQLNQYQCTTTALNCHHHIYTRISVHSTLEIFVVDALYKSTFTYLLTTYLLNSLVLQL